MNTWYKHLILGLLIEIPFLFLFYFRFNWFTDTSSILILIPVIIISPLVLDLDHKLGKLRDKLTDLGMMTSLIGVILWYFPTKLYFTSLNFYVIFIILITTASRFIFYFTHHRGFLHSIPFCFIYGLILFLLTFNKEIVVIGLIGSYSHLIGDKIPFKFR